MKRRLGGSGGNEQLTAVVATLLLVLLAVESATLLDLGRWLTVHAFVGMLLIPVVALKLASTGWRLVRYYFGGEEYVRRGPPHIVLRTLVAPVTVVSTITLFATGVLLLALDQTRGPIVGLHKASFVVWLGAMGVHVLARLPRLWSALQLRIPGLGLRLAAVAAALLAGFAVATLTLPVADQLQDGISAHFGVDAR
jgi:hypothetical protein